MRLRRPSAWPPWRAPAPTTHGSCNEAPDPSESLNVGAMRVESSLAESALGNDCYLSGLATG